MGCPELWDERFLGVVAPHHVAVARMRVGGDGPR